MKKIASFLNQNYAYIRESLEILNKISSPVNDKISTFIDNRWQHMIKNPPNKD